MKNFLLYLLLLFTFLFFLLLLFLFLLLFRIYFFLFILRRFDLELQGVPINKFYGPNGQVLPVPGIHGDAGEFGSDPVIVENGPFGALDGIYKMERFAL